jgi:hypothetical protein
MIEGMVVSEKKPVDGMIPAAGIEPHLKIVRQMTKIWHNQANSIHNQNIPRRFFPIQSFIRTFLSQARSKIIISQKLVTTPAGLTLRFL